MRFWDKTFWRDAVPLAFESLSHGTIAFGFFNIETDLLLLEHYFFFASDFSGCIIEIAESEVASLTVPLPGYDLPYPSIGDLHGAIAGTRLTGFIGEVYRQYPFPAQMAAFKQNPEGFRTRARIEDMVKRYGTPAELPLRVSSDEKTVAIGEFLFSFNEFHALVNYVWRGGYPRWKGEKRPEYVLELAEKIEKSRHPLFDGFAFDP